MIMFVCLLAGNRYVRSMQRLRRLCGAHQQCVAYSSPELASEISSIVHAAKHHSLSEGGGSSSSHHRHHHCNKPYCSKVSCVQLLMFVRTVFKAHSLINFNKCVRKARLD